MPEMQGEETPPIGPVPDYGEGVTYKKVYGALHVWEADDWQQASMSWKETCYVAANLTGPMETIISGPDAQKLLSSLSINDVYKWPIGKSKHLVMLDEEGFIATHGLTVRDGEETFRMLATMPWVNFNADKSDLDVTVELRMIFILQVAGPKSVQVIERASEEGLRDLKFLQFRPISLSDVETDRPLEVSRIGMTGSLAYEIRGNLEDGPAVYDAIYRAGKDLGIVRLGWRTYMVNHAEGGFPQLNGNFLTSVLANEEYMATPYSAIATSNTSGSIDPADVKARFRTPVENDWAWMAKFDHDFIGREALEKEVANPRRKIVTLRWNPDDAVEIMASLFQKGEHYRTIELPCTPQQPDGGNADLVTKDGKAVGVASTLIYSYYFRELIAHCVIDVDQAEVGNEVVVHWGNHGGRIKDVRATVERFPYSDLASNKDYDLDAIPSGI